MEWTELTKGLLTSSPLAGGLGYACWWLVGQLKQAREENAAMRAELSKLQEARIADLKAMLKPKD